jgi:hypothetical protein
MKKAVIKETLTREGFMEAAPDEKWRSFSNVKQQLVRSE